MGLAEVPLLLALIGLAAYVVLGGADFGAGLWYMLLPGERRRPLRDHTYHAMGPVWEANHVWLIFVLVVVWTAYPTRVRRDLLDAVRAAVRGGARDHPARRAATPCAALCRRTARSGSSARCSAPRRC